MTVYVDRLPESGWGKWNGGAHMLGTELAELHALAARIGLRRAWFQDNATFAHYDLTASKRALALQAGAVEIELGELPGDVLMRRQDGVYEPRGERMAHRERAREATQAPAPPSAKPDHRIVSGDLFASGMQTLVNAVNCRGAMGAGVAKAFRARYPDMYEDYRARCERGEVRLGEPYLWVSPAKAGCPRVLNFPTKDHWTESSRLEPIVQGLRRLAANYAAWGIESLAVPALGCGLGNLAWDEVRPVLIEHLSPLPIAIRVYRPRP